MGDSVENGWRYDEVVRYPGGKPGHTFYIQILKVGVGISIYLVNPLSPF